MFENIKNIFKKKPQKHQQRTLIGAIRTRATNWINASLMRVNADINQDLLEVITKCRDLAKNEPIIRAYLETCVKNIIGKSGFTLQCQLKNAQGELDEEFNDTLEWEWYDYGKAQNGFVTTDGHTSTIDFDKLILRTLLIDGECFIRIHKDVKNPFGLSFEIIDSASIDYTKRREAAKGINAIVLGVEIDKAYKPVAYYLRPGNTTTYQVGVSERVPAKEIIHIFKKEFPQQVRGIPPFNSILTSVKQLQDFRDAELMAAKSSACLGIFYERNSNPVAGDFLDESEGEDKGEFVQSLEPGMASIAPVGYNVKSLSPTHPNNTFGEFNKSILRALAASLGISYNTLLKDFESTSYSSLREAVIDEGAFWADWQQFLIENWKEIQFKLFLEALAVNSDVIMPSEVSEAMRMHTWICQRRAYYDKGKDILADRYAIETGLKSPLMILEEQGYDPAEVLKSYSQWKKLCDTYGMSFSPSNEASMPTKEDEEDTLDKARD